ncbi:MAG TPA: hypothetical protein H9825_01150 [Candidatus Sphingobacterium stercorigallinarum]|nr:hypothetical protein [Candidatus Sphingobacterium stercorigallinarum]
MVPYSDNRLANAALFLALLGLILFFILILGTILPEDVLLYAFLGTQISGLVLSIWSLIKRKSSKARAALLMTSISLGLIALLIYSLRDLCVVC